jgi:hypothetical protein
MYRWENPPLLLDARARWELSSTLLNDLAEGSSMPQRGDIVVERLTGKRAMVIKVAGDEITCRFGEGRLEERFAFELETPPSVLGFLLSLLTAPFSSRPRESPLVSGRVRPLVARQPGA